MKKEHEILFEPFKIGTVMIKNRFVLEPMEGTNMIDCLPIFKIGEPMYYVNIADYTRDEILDIVKAEPVFVMNIKRK